MKFDLHIHSMFSFDSQEKPDTIIKKACKLGLDGIVITEHNSFEVSAPWDDYRRDNLVILRAAEYKTREGHVLIYGITSDKYIRREKMPLAELTGIAGGEGWVLVAPHPFQQYDHCLGELVCSCPELAALEINSRCTLEENERTYLQARDLNLKLTGGSDAHFAARTGRVYTEFDDEIQTMEDLVESLKAGNYTYKLAPKYLRDHCPDARSLKSFSFLRAAEVSEEEVSENKSEYKGDSLDVPDFSLQQPKKLVNNRELVDQVKVSWLKIFNRLGYAGFNKKNIYRDLQKAYGDGNWIPAHFYDGAVISRLEGYLIYEEAYYEFLKNNPDIRQWIVATASDVYDIQPSNVECGLDYTKQECDATHLQDISVRRVLTRLKLEEEGTAFSTDNLPVIPIFNGDHLVQIRERTTEGFPLNPGQVPFHQPGLILDSDQKGWWLEGSIEDWYQKNKVLLVNPDVFKVRLAIVGTGRIFFAKTKKVYYEAAFDRKNLADELKFTRGKQARRAFHENHSLSRVANSPCYTFTEWKQTFRKINQAAVEDQRSITFNELFLREPSEEMISKIKVLQTRTPRK